MSSAGLPGSAPTLALAPLQRSAEQAARWLAVAACAALPLPIAALSIVTGLFVVALALAGRPGLRWRRIRDHPVGRQAALLFCWFALAMLWSPAPWRQSVDAWWHYRGLLLMPLVLSVIDDPAWCWRATVAFLAAFTLALLVSYLRRFGVLPRYDHGGDYAGFCGRAGFSLMLALVSYACLWLWRARPRQRALWVALGVAALANLFFVNDGRTGQIVFLVLVPVAAAHWLGVRGVIVGSLVACLLAAGVYQVAPRFRARISEGASNVQGFEERGDPLTNEGQRLSFARNTWTLIRGHPLFGGGSGSFIYEYQRLGARLDPPNAMITHNPHNDILMIWSQQGLPGVALLCWLWTSQWRAARRRGPVSRYLTFGLIAAIAVGGLFNSFLLDTLESHIYALLSVAFDRDWPSSSRSSSSTPTTAFQTSC